MTWFNVYCTVMALLYLACLIAGICLLIYKPELPDHDAWLMGLLLTAISVPLFLGFAIAPVLPREKAVWIYDLVLICIGLTSACTIPACIPLLIFWIKAECKAWFGFDAPRPVLPSPPMG